MTMVLAESEEITMDLRSICLVTGLVVLLGVIPVSACHDGSPLVLDLNGEGIRTTDPYWPVEFDLDADGVDDTIAWTDPDTEEGLLVLDLDGNGSIDGGHELFGDATRLPDGSLAQHGFEALAVWDEVAQGGNEDGIIDSRDLVYGWLRLWIDRNHDGISDRSEIFALARYGVVAIGLDFRSGEWRDAAGNDHRYRGVFLRRVTRDRGPAVVQEAAIHDVYFRYAHEEHLER